MIEAYAQISKVLRLILSRKRIRGRRVSVEDEGQTGEQIRRELKEDEYKSD